MKSPAPSFPESGSSLCPLHTLSTVHHLVVFLVTRLLGYHSAVVQVILILLIMASKGKTSDGGNSDVPKRSTKLLHLSGRLTVV